LFLHCLFLHSLHNFLVCIIPCTNPWDDAFPGYWTLCLFLTAWQCPDMHVIWKTPRTWEEIWIYWIFLPVRNIVRNVKKYSKCFIYILPFGALFLLFSLKIEIAYSIGTCTLFLNALSQFMKSYFICWHLQRRSMVSINVACTELLKAIVFLQDTL